MAEKSKKPEVFASEQFEELEEEKKEKKNIEEEKKQKKPVESRIKSEKIMLIALGIIIAVFLGLILGYRFLFGGTETLTIEELHNLNLAGELNEEKGYLYNGFSFVRVDDTWFTRFKRASTEQPFNVQLRYGPKDVEDIPLEGDYLYLLNFNSTYITFDPLGKNLSHIALAAADISSNLVAVLERSAIAACLRDETAVCKKRPIVNCSSGFPTIYIKEDPRTKVIASGTCIVIQGQGIDLVKAVDRLLLAWYGIMS